MRRGLAAAITFVAMLSLAPGVMAQGDTISVSADGSADHETIGTAIEAAAAGDVILIAPGEYAENLVIDKPITLRGAGERDEVIVSPGVGMPARRDVPDTDEPIVTHVFVDGVDATIENLSLVDDDERIQAGLMLTGGEPVIRDVVSPRIIGVNGDIDATIEGSDLGRIILMGADATMTARDNSISDGLIVGMGSTAVVEGNLIIDWPIDVVDAAHLVATGNTFRPAEGAHAIWHDWAGGSVTAIDNVIEGGFIGIEVQHADELHLEGNSITGAEHGINVVESGGVIRDNTITDSVEEGILVSGNGTVVEDNAVVGGRIGIISSVPNGYPPGAPRWDEPSRFTGNDVRGASHFGVLINDAAPLISGNTICAGREPLKLEGKASPQLGTNEICEVEG